MIHFDGCCSDLTLRFDFYRIDVVVGGLVVLDVLRTLRCPFVLRPSTFITYDLSNAITIPHGTQPVVELDTFLCRVPIIIPLPARLLFPTLQLHLRSLPAPDCPHLTPRCWFTHLRWNDLQLPTRLRYYNTLQRPPVTHCCCCLHCCSQH